MNETVLYIFFGILAIVIVLSSIIANYYYQRKAKLYADEMLKQNPEEWNKRVKANSWRHLISRGIWGLFFSSFIYGVWSSAKPVIFSKLFLLAVGIFFIVWGITGFRAEMKKLQDFE